MRIKELRAYSGKTQYQIAQALGLSRQVFANYENEVNYPDPNTLIKIADYFNTSVDYLIGHTQISRIIEETSAFDLNQKEAQVIQRFRLANRRQKDCVLNILDCFSQK